MVLTSTAYTSRGQAHALQQSHMHGDTEADAELRAHWLRNQLLEPPLMLVLLLPGESTSCTVPEEDADSGDGGASVRPFAISSLYLRHQYE